MQATLTTIGRRSRQPRSVTLYAWPDGDRLIVVGSRGGSDRDPSWVLNLRAEPMVSIRTGRAERPVRAVEVIGEERERLWALVTEAFPMYASYQRRTKRTIPLFALEPTGETASEAST
jgi:deazaflavin-dependent oxidoreductase (nitroreductase family)